MLFLIFSSQIYAQGDFDLVNPGNTLTGVSVLPTFEFGDSTAAAHTIQVLAGSTDFDGGGGLADCFDVSQIKNITIELVRRGYTEKEIEKIWGGNFMRVFNEVVQLAAN